METYHITWSSTCSEPRARQVNRRSGPRSRGFTLIELLVTITVLGVVLALAIPSFADFLRAGRGSAISTDFVRDMMRARSEAISQNTCVKLCQSANIANAQTGGTPTCAASGNDWQRGWILFTLPSCDTTQTNPTASGARILSIRVGEDPEFELFTTSGAARRFFVFDPRGVLQSGGMTNLTLSYVPDGVSSRHTRSVCVSSAGRVTVREYGGVDGCN